MGVTAFEKALINLPLQKYLNITYHSRPLILYRLLHGKPYRSLALTDTIKCGLYMGLALEKLYSKGNKIILVKNKGNIFIYLAISFRFVDH